MKFEFRKFNTRTESLFDQKIFVKYGIPKFVYGDLICFRHEDRFGCLNKTNLKFSIPLKYDSIEVAENGIVTAFSCTYDGLMEIDFYDRNGKYLTKYSLAKTDAFYVEQDETTICCLDWEDWDEDTFSVHRGYISILSDGKVLHKMLTDEEKKCLWKNISKPVYINSDKVECFDVAEIVSKESFVRIIELFPDAHFIVKDNHLLMFENDAYGLDISFGNATKRRFFKTEEERKRYISNFEEKVLNEMINIVEL